MVDRSAEVTKEEKEMLDDAYYSSRNYWYNDHDQHIACFNGLYLGRKLDRIISLLEQIRDK